MEERNSSMRFIRSNWHRLIALALGPAAMVLTTAVAHAAGDGFGR